MTDYQTQTINAIKDFLTREGDYRFLELEVELKLDTRLIGDLPEFDSLDEIELVMHLEDVFNIELQDEDIERFKVRTVGSYVTLVNEKLNEHAPPTLTLMPRNGPNGQVNGPPLTQLLKTFGDIPEVSGKVAPKRKPQIRVSAVLNNEKQRQMWLKLGGANWLRKFLAATAKGRSQ